MAQKWHLIRDFRQACRAHGTRGAIGFFTRGLLVSMRTVCCPYGTRFNFRLTQGLRPGLD
jgi:hypothetical protein